MRQRFVSLDDQDSQQAAGPPKPTALHLRAALPGWDMLQGLIARSAIGELSKGVPTSLNASHSSMAGGGSLGEHPTAQHIIDSVSQIMCGILLIINHGSVPGGLEADVASPEAVDFAEGLACRGPDAQSDHQVHFKTRLTVHAAADVVALQPLPARHCRLSPEAPLFSASPPAGGLRPRAAALLWLAAPASRHRAQRLPSCRCRRQCSAVQRADLPALLARCLPRCQRCAAAAGCAGRTRYGCTGGAD